VTLAPILESKTPCSRSGLPGLAVPLSPAGIYRDGALAGPPPATVLFSNMLLTAYPELGTLLFPRNVRVEYGSLGNKRDDREDPGVG
jgi:hypothetical protein